tara:strand:- start:223 stop:675 length:453 start_codon:yes stop_codon:yes gene_type:complete
MKSISINKKANFNYIITEKIEAGIVLTGSEVKSLRNNSVSIKESYIAEKNSEIWLFNCHISNYSNSLDSEQNPIRIRKILLSKREKNKITNSANKKGFTVIPISLYFNRRGIAKMLIGLGKGKKNVDKRQSIKEREWNINKQRLMKNQKT